MARRSQIKHTNPLIKISLVCRNYCKEKLMVDNYWDLKNNYYKQKVEGYPFPISLILKMSHSASPGVLAVSPMVVTPCLYVSEAPSVLDAGTKRTDTNSLYVDLNRPMNALSIKESSRERLTPLFQSDQQERELWSHTVLITLGRTMPPVKYLWRSYLSVFSKVTL